MGTGSAESWASSAATRASMQGNRRRDTKPEMAVRRAVHALGLRYRVDTRPLPNLNRRADLVFTGAKVAVFVDGCYWHGCPEHGTTAKTNAAYWGPKIQGNRDRDVETNRLLSEAGWTVVRVWEHDDAREAALRVAGAVRSALRSAQSDSVSRVAPAPRHRPTPTTDADHGNVNHADRSHHHQGLDGRAS